MNRVRLVVAVAILGAGLLVAAGSMRTGRCVPPSVQRVAKAQRPETAPRDESEPVVPDLLPSAPQEKSPAGPVTAPADPLRQTVKSALQRFSALQTYRFDMKVRVYEKGVVIFETHSTGDVLGHSTVVGEAEVDGQVVEVVTNAGESRVRVKGEEEWRPVEGEEQQIGSPAVDMAQMLSDPELDTMPVEAAAQAAVDGVACRAVKMELSNGETGGKSKVTMYVDSTGNIRKWRMESEVQEEGRRLTTVVDSSFGGFDEPWTHDMAALAQRSGG